MNSGGFNPTEPLRTTVLHRKQLLLCTELYDLLFGVADTKSTGPDNIAGHVIKSTACSITSAVTAVSHHHFQDWSDICTLLF